MMTYTILYVEDDHDDLLLVTEAFEKYTDYLRVVHASNGFEALQTLPKMKAEGSLPCLIILDINMPVMDGKTTLKNLRNDDDFKDLPVVMFSTSNNRADRLFAEAFGADFITKPVTYNDMESLVKQFARRCRVSAIH